MPEDHHAATPESARELKDPRGAMASAWASYSGLITSVEDHLCRIGGSGQRKTR